MLEILMRLILIMLVAGTIGYVTNSLAFLYSTPTPTENVIFGVILQVFCFCFGYSNGPFLYEALFKDGTI